MEALLDLSKMQADTSWELEEDPGGRAKWPPVKIMLSGPLRELGAKPRALAAEDFVREVVMRKMEGDIRQLEGLNKPAAAASAWTAKAKEPAPNKQPAPKKSRRRKRDRQPPEQAPAGQVPAKQAPAASAAPAAASARSFEQRMRDALDAAGPAAR